MTNTFWQPKNKLSIWAIHNDDGDLGKGPRELPKVKIGRKTYFVDSRLNELRNTKNPSDSEKMEASEDFYVKEFGEK